MPPWAAPGKSWPELSLAAPFPSLRAVPAPVFPGNALGHSLCSSREFCSSGIAAPSPRWPQPCLWPWLPDSLVCRNLPHCQEELSSKARQKLSLTSPCLKVQDGDAHPTGPSRAAEHTPIAESIQDTWADPLSPLQVPLPAPDPCPDLALAVHTLPKL